MDRIDGKAATSTVSSFWTDAYEYATDAWQRSVLYADVMRQRGNQYREHMERAAPGVLSLDVEMIADGRDRPRAVNYSLMRVIPPADAPVDPFKRPFIVVDPRAGHGPGIGGFKAESEVGVAVRAGHPCYFIGFLPNPEPAQTVEDVMRAEAAFIEQVIALHPDAEGKPVVIGNCQAGWQIMMTAAMRPELFGPIILAGAPLSYWAGWRGKNPMRYFGGLAGGSWVTAMTSDMGGGQFDGAWLVKNFEGLNPSNTHWSKQYQLYANVDTEAERYLGFEKWWGGHVYLNDKEIQYIVDNLFVGNRLSTATLVTSDGIRIDLRNIQSPIIVFCSKGDNITPPPQALGWITDLYQSDEQVRAHGQTIVYAVHESIGHLGIFVSGSVARKEHQEFTSNIDLIDVLPPGIYEADFRDKTPDMPNGNLARSNYVMEIAGRNLDDVRRIVEPNPDDERRFAAVKRISEMNLGMYRSFVQPWVRQWFTPQVAEWMQRLHPLRMPYEMISDANPAVAAVAPLADQVREARQPVSPDNTFLRVQNHWSDAVVTALDFWRDLRDAAAEQTFMAVYGSPLVQNLAGLGGREGAPRKHPGVHPEHRQFMERRADELRQQVAEGGLREACVRLLLYVSQGQGLVDTRSFDLIRRMRTELDDQVALQAFKDIVRDQALMMLLDLPRAVKSLPRLMVGATGAEIRSALAHMEAVLTAGTPLNDVSASRLNEMRRIFVRAAERAEQKAQAGAPVEAEVEVEQKPSAAKAPVERERPVGAAAPKAADRTVAAAEQDRKAEAVVAAPVVAPAKPAVKKTAVQTPAVKKAAVKKTAVNKAVVNKAASRPAAKQAAAKPVSAPAQPAVKTAEPVKPAVPAAKAPEAPAVKPAAAPVQAAKAAAPAAKPETKPEAKPAAKPEATKPEAKSGAKSEAKPEAKPAEAPAKATAALAGVPAAETAWIPRKTDAVQAAPAAAGAAAAASPAAKRAPARKAAAAKTAAAKPVEAKPVEAKSVEAKSVEAKSVEAKSVEAKPVAGSDQPAASRTASAVKPGAARRKPSQA